MIKPGDEVFYARMLCIGSKGIFTVDKLKVRTVDGNYYVASDSKTSRAHDFYEKDIDRTIFTEEKKAKETVEAAKKAYRSKIKECGH